MSTFDSPIDKADLVFYNKGMSYEKVVSDDFTGALLYVWVNSREWHLMNYVNGKLHKELGPSIVSDKGNEFYDIDNMCHTYEEYWNKMFEKYKGTDDEGLCLSKLLGEK